MALLKDSLMKIGRGICLQTRNTLGRVVDHMTFDPSKRNHYAPQLPRRTFQSQRLASLQQRRNLSPSDRKFFKSNFPTYNKINRLECVGSIQGWLIMVDNECWNLGSFGALANPWSFHLLHDQQSGTRFSSVNFFFDPISGDRVMLPSQSTVPFEGSDRPSFFKKVVASSAPTIPHCLVAALCRQGRLAFCRPTDKSWAFIDQGMARDVEFCDIEIINGKLHAALRNAPELLVEFNMEVDAARPPAYFAESLQMLEPVQIPSHITKSDRGLKDLTSKELFTKNVLHQSYSFDLEEDEVVPWTEVRFDDDSATTPPKTVGFRVTPGPENIRRVFRQNWKHTKRMHQTQCGRDQAPGLLCLVR